MFFHAQIATIYFLSEIQQVQYSEKENSSERCRAAYSTGSSELRSTGQLFISLYSKPVRGSRGKDKAQGKCQERKRVNGKEGEIRGSLWILTHHDLASL